MLGHKNIDFGNGVIAMTSPLRRIAAGLSLLAAAFFLVAALLPGDANAQSPPVKRAAPTNKSKAVRPAAAASGWVANPAVDGRDAYIILDATSGRELSSDQPDGLRHPASLTKVMTIYLTFSALDSGRLSLGDGLPVSLAALTRRRPSWDCRRAARSACATPPWRW